MNTVLITGAGGPLGVNFSRCLRESDRSFRLIGTDANRWHLPLSICDQTYEIPLASDFESYTRALAEIIESEKVDALIPTHPVEVRAVATMIREELLPVATALPPLDVIEVCDDKAITQQRLRNANVPVPETLVLADPSRLHEAFRRWSDDGRTPVWVRGSGAPGLGIGGAALPCVDESVARAWVEHHGGWGKMSASEYLPGANLTWMALFSSGRLVASGSRERLEYVLPHVSPSGITGAPAVSRTISRDDVARIGEVSVRAVDGAPHGVYFVDMKEDADGQPRVTEINGGRCGTTIHFYSRAGMNFPELLVRLAIEGDLEPLAESDAYVRSGLYWVRTLDCGPVLVDGDSGFDGYPRAGFDLDGP